MRLTPRGSEPPQPGSKKAAASSTKRTTALLRDGGPPEGGVRPHGAAHLLSSAAGRAAHT